MIYFSASEMGFYDPLIHNKGSIPDDAKEITVEERDRLVNGQAEAVLSSDEDGYPILESHQ